MLDVIEKYIDYLEKEVERCEKYLDNIADIKIKYGLRENPNLEGVTFCANDTSDPQYTANVLRQKDESLIMLDFFHTEGQVLFGNFRELSRSLINSNLKLSEQYEVLKYLIKGNIDLLSLNGKRYVFDVKKIQDIKLKYLTKDELNLLIDNSQIDIFLRKVSLFDKNLKRKQKELKRILPSILVNTDEMEKIYIKINDEFMLDELTEESINSFYDSLIKLRVVPMLCDKIKYYLLKQIKSSKEDKKEYNFDFKVKESKNYMSIEETRKIMKEINDVFDFNEKEIKTNVSYSKVLYYVELMKKVNIDENVIRIFLKKFEEEDKKRNPISRYIELRDKLIYYKDKYGLQEQISNMDEYFEELFDLNDESFNESYDYWEDAIGEELDKALSYIPKNFEYELKD